MTILKPKFILFFILIAAAAFFYSVKGESMSLFGKGEKVCLFSGFDGKITLNGEPASGAKIIRKVAWKDDVGESQEIVTNQNGEFSFDSWWDVDTRKFISQFSAQQEMSVHYKEKKYEIWVVGKLLTEEFSEFNGERRVLSCNLTDEVEPFELELGLGITSCEWDGIER